MTKVFESQASNWKDWLPAESRKYYRDSLSEIDVFKLQHHINKLEWDRFINPSSPNVNFLTNEQVEAIIKMPLPSPSEQVDNFIRCLAESPTCHKGSGTNYISYGCLIGSFTENMYKQVIDYIREKKLIDCNSDTMRFYGILTIEGWAYYEKLQKGKINSNKAFMAMQLNKNDGLDDMLENHFKPAALKTGFKLLKIDDKPKAGLIDNHIRIAIRTAAFVVADLSHKNPGAYFEAGFAEGLDKPVIYTCAESEKENMHFDTNHHQTIFWNEKEPQQAADNLKAAIRATLPGKAKMQDD